MAERRPRRVGGATLCRGELRPVRASRVGSSRPALGVAHARGGGGAQDQCPGPAARRPRLAEQDKEHERQLERGSLTSGSPAAAAFRRPAAAQRHAGRVAWSERRRLPARKLGRTRRLRPKESLRRRGLRRRRRGILTHPAGCALATRYTSAVMAATWTFLGHAEVIALHERNVPRRCRRQSATPRSISAGSSLASELGDSGLRTCALRDGIGGCFTAEPP